MGAEREGAERRLDQMLTALVRLEILWLGELSGGWRN